MATAESGQARAADGARIAQLLVAGIPDARLELLPGARHGYYLDDPSSSRVVLDFIREHPMAQT